MSIEFMRDNYGNEFGVLIDEEAELIHYNNDSRPVSAVRDPGIDDNDYNEQGFPVAIEMTHEIGEELLRFIYERQEVMRVLKIHPMSILSKPMQELVLALEHIYPGVEKPTLKAEPHGH